mmetsp:Transcript_60082/g.172478  ORF Transcript_60082/g.172478 Transcript_60082/m.172478 type:complete len:252 (+) Transcript_60082:837-1592(+)
MRCSVRLSSFLVRHREQFGSGGGSEGRDRQDPSFHRHGLGGVGQRSRDGCQHRLALQLRHRAPQRRGCHWQPVLAALQHEERHHLPPGLLPHRERATGVGRGLPGALPRGPPQAREDQVLREHLDRRDRSSSLAFGLLLRHAALCVLGVGLLPDGHRLHLRVPLRGLHRLRGRRQPPRAAPRGEHDRQGGDHPRQPLGRDEGRRRGVQDRGDDQGQDSEVGGEQGPLPVLEGDHDVQGQGGASRAHGNRHP